MENVRRIYVEKKNGFDVEAKGVLADLKENLSLKGLKDVRIINRYDVSGVSDEEYQKARNLIFSEPPVDNAYDEEIEISEGKVFAVEFLPGQFDQRAASAEECISILTEKERPTVRSAKVYVLIGDISDEETEAVKNYVINPVEAREASLEKPTSLVMETVVPDDVATVDGFTEMDESKMEEFLSKMGFAMDMDDLAFCQKYFKDTEKRNPTITELRMIDTYWSDHCRHTTFSTELTEVSFGDGDYRKPMEDTYKEYLQTHSEIFKGREDKFVCLMDLALMAMKKLKKHLREEGVH